MKVETTKHFMEACHMAKNIVNSLPPLPDQLTARHIHVIDCISRLSEKNDNVRISDVANEMHSTRPSITKLINEMVDRRIVTKRQSSSDHRVFTVKLTAKGRRYYDIFIGEYYQKLTALIEPKLTDEDVMNAVDVIMTIYDITSNEPIVLGTEDK